MVTARPQEPRVGPGRRLLVSAVCPGWACLPQPGPAALPENSATSVSFPGPGGPEAEDGRQGRGYSEAAQAHHGPCSPPFPLRQRVGTGQATAVQVLEAIGPAGAPPLPGLWRLHLAAVPHAPLGMEVMEEISEGETLHFQAGLEDPGWEGGGMSHRSTKGSRGRASPLPRPHQALAASHEAGVGQREPNGLGRVSEPLSLERVNGYSGGCGKDQ